MRTAVVESSKLGADWTARAHCPVDPKDLREASEAGWDSGARGTKSPTSMWAHYGRLETRNAFWDAYEAGKQARKEFLRCLSSKCAPRV